MEQDRGKDFGGKIAFYRTYTYSAQKCVAIAGLLRLKDFRTTPFHVCEHDIRAPRFRTYAVRLFLHREGVC
jgi:hypothetical protein